MLLLLACGSSGADETTLRDAIEHYVGHDCEVGEAGGYDQKLRAHGDEAIPLLQQLLDDGPDPAALDAMRAEIERSWEARLEFLESSGATGLSIESQQNVTLRDHESYVNRRLDSYRARVRERAAHGLATIGSPAARRALVESAAGQVGSLSDLIERLISPAERLRNAAAVAAPRAENQRTRKTAKTARTANKSNNSRPFLNNAAIPPLPLFFHGPRRIRTGFTRARAQGLR